MSRVCVIVLLVPAAHAWWWADYWEDRKQDRWDIMEGKKAGVACDYPKAQQLLGDARWDVDHNNKWNPCYKSNLNHQVDVLVNRVEQERRAQEAREAAKAAERQAEKDAAEERERRAAEEKRRLVQAAQRGASVAKGEEEGEHTPGYSEAKNETVPAGGKEQLRKEVNEMRSNAKVAVERARSKLADHAWGFATASGLANGIGGAMAMVGPWATIAGTAGAVAADVLLLGAWCKHCNDTYTDACNFQTLQDEFLLSTTFNTAIRYEWIEVGLKPLLKVGWHQAMTRTQIAPRLAERATSVFSRLSEVTLATLSRIYSRILATLTPKYAAKRLAQASAEQGAATTTRQVFNWVPVIGAIVGAVMGFAFMRHTCGTVNIEFRDKYLGDIDSYYDSLLTSLQI